MGTTYAGSAWCAGSPHVSPPADEALGLLPEDALRLTPRELEVLNLIGDGFYNCEIAGRLGISYHTLHRHVNAILEKLDARNRMEAYTISLRDGYIECPRICKYRYAGTA